MNYTHAPPKGIQLRCAGNVTATWIYQEKDGYSLLDEAYLARKIPGFRSLNERARKKARDKYLDRFSIQEVQIPSCLPNCRGKLLGEDGRKRRVTKDDLQTGARTILRLLELFKNAEAGCEVLASILAGMRCEALRKAEPDFHAVVEVSSAASELEEMLTVLVKAVVTRKRWRNGKVKRLAVLDYRAGPGDLPHHLQDFGRVKVNVKGLPTLRFPPPYIDTAVLIIGADSTQLREAAPYLENAAVLLLNCGGNDWDGRRLRMVEIAEYDPVVVEDLRTSRQQTAVLLRAWWADEGNEAAWARRIVAEARASFGKPDRRYILTRLDPRVLSRAIRYQVLCSFLDWLEAEELLADEDLEHCRATVRSVYDPAPVEETPPQHVEDPQIFRRIMRELVGTVKIAGENEDFRKGDKFLGAWRTISGERHLVMPEEGWKKAYQKAARAAKDVDCSFFQKDQWERELQRILAEDGMIKKPHSGARYRYDLYGTGKRDSTYVVAVPEKLLAEP